MIYMVHCSSFFASSSVQIFNSPDWKDAISYRITGVGNPWNFVHKVHVSRSFIESDYLLIRIQGIPDEWRKLLSLGKPDIEQSPSMVANELESSAVLLRHRPSVPLPQFRVSSGRIVLRISINTPTDPGHTSVGLSVYDFMFAISVRF